MMTGHNEIRLIYDYHLRRSQFQKSSCKRDLEVHTVPSLSPENYIWRIVKEVNCILINVKTAFNYMDSEMLKYIPY